MTLKTIAQGFGAAMLLMVSRIAPLISPYHSVLYHSILPMRSVVWGTLIDLALASLLASLVFHSIANGQTSRRPLIRALIWALVATGLVHTLLGVPLATLGWALPLRAREMAVALTLFAALLLWYVRPTAYRAAVRGLRMLLLLAGFNALWMVPELLHLGLHSPPTEAAMTVAPHSAGAPPVLGHDRRIIWLLFDELSYDQTFDHRFAGLAMPTFEQFKRNSVVFSNLEPVGSATDLVIPALFLGTPVSGIRSTLNGNPSLRLGNDHQWQAFADRTTLFSDAHQLGWTTGVVGWFNPYCRILAGTLDSCYWRMGDGEFNGPASTKSSLQNALSPLQNAMWWLERKPGYFERVHAEDFAAIMPAAKSLVRDERIRFVFIHLPVPHLPGIYDRKNHALRAGGTYIDNLALSDRVLNQLLTAIDATTLATKTTVIVCSDHSWRVPLWQSRPLWTKEDQAASNGRMDARPVLMVRLPGQQTEQDVTEPFDELKLHEIIERLLHDQNTGQDAGQDAGQDIGQIVGQIVGQDTGRSSVP